MTTATLLWVLILGGLDAIAVFLFMRSGVKHDEHPPAKAEESRAVAQLRAMNAERLARIEAARARQLPSGEAKPS